jgi:hypothetical protein
MATEKIRSERRQQRLAEALKANIARRKAQARTRQEGEDVPESASEDDGCPN